MTNILALIAFLFPTYLIRFEVAGIPSTLFEVLIWLAFIYGLFLLARDRTAQTRLFRRWVWLVPATLIELGAILGILVAPDMVTALGLYKGFILDPMLVYLLALAFLHTKEDALLVARGLFVGAAGVAIWSLIDAGTSASVGSGLSVVEGLFNSGGRAIGPYALDSNASPNYLAFALAPLLPLAVWVGSRRGHLRGEWPVSSEVKEAGSDRHGRPSDLAMTIWGWAALISIAALVIILGLHASDSRAGVVAALGGLVIAMVLAWSTVKGQLSKVLVVGLLVICALSWFAVKPDFSLSAAEGGRITASNNVRWQLWSATGELVQEHWLLGTGLGGFQTRFTELTADRVNYPEFIAPKARTPHNLFVGMWMETGLLGLAGMFMILVLVGKSLFAALRRRETQAVVAALLGSWFVLLSHGLVDQPIWKNDTMVLFWLLVALSAAVVSTSKTKGDA